MRHTKTLAVIAGVLACALACEWPTRATSTSTWTNAAHALHRQAHSGRGAREHRRAASRRKSPRAPTPPTRPPPTQQLTASNQRIADRAGRLARRRERRQGSRSFTRSSAARRRARPTDTSINSQRLYRAGQGWQARIPDRCRARAAAHRLRQGGRSHLRPPRLSIHSPMLHERRPSGGVFLCGACA